MPAEQSTQFVAAAVAAYDPAAHAMHAVAPEAGEDEPAPQLAHVRADPLA